MKVNFIVEICVELGKTKTSFGVWRENEKAEATSACSGKNLSYLTVYLTVVER